MIKSRVFRKFALAQILLIVVTALVVVLIATPRVEEETLDTIEEGLDAQARLLRDIARPALRAPGDEQVVAHPVVEDPPSVEGVSE